MKPGQITRRTGHETEPHFPEWPSAGTLKEETAIATRTPEVVEITSPVLDRRSIARRISERIFLRRVRVTNYSHSPEFHHHSEHMGSNIGTAGVIAEIFGKPFFVAVRTCDSRPDRHLRHSSDFNNILAKECRWNKAVRKHPPNMHRVLRLCWLSVRERIIWSDAQNTASQARVRTCQLTLGGVFLF